MTNRIGQRGQKSHDESRKFPGHEERMKAYCERVKREYFDSGLQVEQRVNEVMDFLLPDRDKV